jgi:hypothetical protein
MQNSIEDHDLLSLIEDLPMSGYYLDMIVIDEKFLVIKEINGYQVDMILINSFRSEGGGESRPPPPTNLTLRQCIIVISIN